LKLPKFLNRAARITFPNNLHFFIEYELSAQGTDQPPFSPFSAIPAGVSPSYGLLLIRNFVNNLAASIFRVLFKKFRARIPACPQLMQPFCLWSLSVSCHRPHISRKGKLYLSVAGVVIVLAGILIYNIS